MLYIKQSSLVSDHFRSHFVFAIEIFKERDRERERERERERVRQNEVKTLIHQY
jgi:hypothetical protein